MEFALEEARETLGGEDPALPESRERFLALRSALLAVRDEIAPLLGPLELPEPDERLRALLREAVGDGLRPGRSPGDVAYGGALQL